MVELANNLIPAREICENQRTKGHSSLRPLQREDA
jgi:hypothetical protein